VRYNYLYLTNIIIFITKNNWKSKKLIQINITDTSGPCEHKKTHTDLAQSQTSIWVLYNRVLYATDIAKCYYFSSAETRTFRSSFSFFNSIIYRVISSIFCKSTAFISPNFKPFSSTSEAVGTPGR